MSFVRVHGTSVSFSCREIRIRFWRRLSFAQLGGDYWKSCCFVNFELVAFEYRVADTSVLDFDTGMSALQQIEEQVKRLSPAEQQALREWLDDILEDELEFTDEFKAKIEKARREISEGGGRVVRP